MMLRLLVSIPGPINSGVMIDSTCILGNSSECGTKGSFWIYDNIKSALMPVAISVTCKMITIFFNELVVLLYKQPPLDTDVSFQNPNAVVTAVSVECDLSKAGNEGWNRKRGVLHSWEIGLRLQERTMPLLHYLLKMDNHFKNWWFIIKCVFCKKKKKRDKEP